MCGACASLTELSGWQGLGEGHAADASLMILEKSLYLCHSGREKSSVCVLWHPVAACWLGWLLWSCSEARSELCGTSGLCRKQQGLLGDGAGRQQGDRKHLEADAGPHVNSLFSASYFVLRCEARASASPRGENAQKFHRPFNIISVLQQDKKGPFVRGLKEIAQSHSLPEALMSTICLLVLAHKQALSLACPCSGCSPGSVSSSVTPAVPGHLLLRLLQVEIQDQLGKRAGKQQKDN